MTGTADQERAVRRYRRLLRLFPPAYRRSAGDEAVQVFRDEFEDVASTGERMPVARLWVRVAFDMVFTLPGAWWTYLRPERGGEGMRTWIGDLHTAARGLMRQPRFALGAACTLALGIGATTAVYSVVDGVMLRPLPYGDAATLVAVGATDPLRPWLDQGAGLQDLQPLRMDRYLGLVEQSRAFGRLAAVEQGRILLADRGEGPEMVATANVGDGFLEILGAAPVLGRVFLPEDYAGTSDPVAMITYGGWLRRFGGDPEALGATLPRLGSAVTIVGILPRDFQPLEAFVAPDATPELYLPIQSRRFERPGARIHVVGRLEPGASIEQARAEAAEIARALDIELPEVETPTGDPVGIGVNALHAQTVGTTGGALVLFLAAASLLLVLSAMNAATLFLTRALDRGRELTVRVALGAHRLRVARLLIGEALLVSLLGGLLGVGIAFLSVAAFLRWAPGSIPRLDAVAVDVRVLAVALIVSLGAGIVAGAVPLVRVLGRDTWGRLQRGGYGAAEPILAIRSLLVGGQVTVAVVLLSGAALLFGSFVRIRGVDPGFEPDDLVTMRVEIEVILRDRSVAGFTLPSTSEEMVSQAEDLLADRLGAIPGVGSVGVVTSLPFQAPSWAPQVLLEDDSPDTVREGIAGYIVSPEYFETVGTRVMRGRGIGRADGLDAEPVAVVNEEFVVTQLGGADPLGRSIRIVDAPRETVAKIVGVVEDVVQTRAEDGRRPAIYVPNAQRAWPIAHVVARSERPVEALLPELRAAAAGISPNVPLQDLGTMRERMSAARTTPRFRALLVGAFALVALLLAATGLYGSLSHSVGRRRRELGVRMALGADRGGVLRMILREGMLVSGAGLLVGLGAALVSMRTLGGFLYGLEPHDPVALVSVGVVLLLVAGGACLVPALRATGVDPVRVLREE